MSYCTLTICFEAPFWVGVVESEDDEGRYRVAKHTFGSEPTDPEVGVFIHEQWNELHFTDELQVRKSGGTKISYKRMQRMIAKEVASHARRGTKAQQALAEARDVASTERKHRSAAVKREKQEERFLQRTDKRKRKHRGH
ncbi:MAG: YjdF family protein [Eggerthellaceae bacterium]|jgi:hypothetical protein|nr:YjdF family protein [Eggerthellaceae bacterium]MCH4221189.1 YjdF family protein [Eggerthellaceae bacterium]